jgi:hypothetical protein
MDDDQLARMRAANAIAALNGMNTKAMWRDEELAYAEKADRDREERMAALAVAREEERRAAAERAREQTREHRLVLARHRLARDVALQREQDARRARLSGAVKGGSR